MINAKLFIKKNYLHFFSITFLFLHYFLPLVIFGQIILNPFDSLEIISAYDYIIGEIYKGNIESLSNLLGGKIEWYHIERLFYPINILHYFLNDKYFYFANDVLYKLFAYFSFYLLAKSFSTSKIICSLGAILYSTILFKIIPFGFGLPFMPYILYLLLNKNNFKKKHYLALILISLNMSFVRDIFAMFFLIPLSFILRGGKNNLNICIQFFLVTFVISILSSLHIILGSTLFEPIHRVLFESRVDLANSFFESFNFLLIGFNYTFFTSFFNFPLDILFLVLLALSLFSKIKQAKLIFYFIIFILILRTIVGSNLIDGLFFGIFEILKSIEFTRLDRILPLTFALLFIFIATYLQNTKIKKSLYFLCILSILFIQIKIPLPQISKFLLQKNMNSEKFEEIKKEIYENNYISIFKIIFDKQNYVKNKINFDQSVNNTFKNYFKYKDYTFIKNLVKKSRVMSIGLDPTIAVVNNIRVIDGYHTIYPLNYKKRFRKIIEKELEKNAFLKNYYDNWGNRVYAFYNDKNNIMLNFSEAKNLGADFIISKFPIESSELKIVCYKCNNSNNLYLYEIL